MPDKFSQTERPMAVTTPLGADVLLIERLTGQESLSELFAFRLDLLAQTDAPVKFEELLGKAVSVEVRSAKVVRQYHGIVAKLTEGRQVRANLTGTVFFAYRAEVVPKIWLLGRMVRSRIFQHLSIKEILEKVFTGYDVEYKISGTNKPVEKRDYCVQYRETDLAFAMRLMEEEGLFFFFKHTSSAHTMVITDDPQNFVDVEDPGVEEGPKKTVVFRRPETGKRAKGDELEHKVEAWEKVQEIRSGKYMLWDHCFEKVTGGKHDNFEAMQPIAETVVAGTITHKIKLAENTDLEIYDYPGRFAQRFDGIDKGGAEQAAELGKIAPDGTRTVKIRMEQEAAPGLVITGASTCPFFTAGGKFTLKDHFDADGDYTFTAIDHQASIEGAYTSNEANVELKYANRFRCIPAAVPYRPQRRTAKPTVQGCHTAVVVGPEGEEIFTDKYSRVKVQFHWDREGKANADSSCWIRVGSIWAGKQWGAIHIPRIGQEVIVDFLEGDPDQPIIIGSVYNAEQMPPYLLPDNKTQSGIKSRSSLKGDDKYFNELKFEDLKDKEQIYFHAQKDFERVVEYKDTLKIGFGEPEKESKLKDGSQQVDIYNNQTTNIGIKDCVDGSQAIKIYHNQTLDIGHADKTDGSQTIVIFNNQNLTIGNDKSDVGSQTVTIFKDRTTTLTKGNDTLKISEGNRSMEVSKGNEELKIATGTRTLTIKGDETHTVEAGKYALTIKQGDMTVKLDAGKIGMEAATAIEFKVGGSSLKIEAAAITISTTTLSMKGSGTAELAGASTTVKGDASLVLKGGTVAIN